MSVLYYLSALPPNIGLTTSELRFVFYKHVRGLGFYSKRFLENISILGFC